LSKDECEAFIALAHFVDSYEENFLSLDLGYFGSLLGDNFGAGGFNRKPLGTISKNIDSRRFGFGTNKLFPQTNSQINNFPFKNLDSWFF